MTTSQNVAVPRGDQTTSSTNPPRPAGGHLTTYNQLRAVNWSGLKHMDVSPLHYKWRLDHPDADKQAYVIGRAIHCLLLEADKFSSRFAVYDGVRRGKAWDEWLAENGDSDSLKPDEMARVEATVSAIRNHRVARRLIDSCRFEEVTTWTDPETGLACKGRMDGISPAFVVDLKKTARPPTGRQFGRSAAEYLYHGQMAFYSDGATLAHKIPGDQPPYIIAVEDSGPFDVVVYQLSDATLAAGRAVYRSLLRRLAQCLEADYWPGIAADVQPLDLPAWADVPAEDQLSEGDF